MKESKKLTAEDFLPKKWSLLFHTIFDICGVPSIKERAFSMSLLERAREFNNCNYIEYSRWQEAQEFIENEAKAGNKRAKDCLIRISEIEIKGLALIC
jgi:hypothetical protein